MNNFQFSILSFNQITIIKTCRSARSAWKIFRSERRSELKGDPPTGGESGAKVSEGIICKHERGTTITFGTFGDSKVQ